MMKNLLNGRRLLFVGGGNMAFRIIRGLLCQNAVDKNEIVVCDSSEERCRFLRNETGAAVISDIRKWEEVPDIVIIAVPPECVGAAVDDIKSLVKEETLVLSVCAGVTLKTLKGQFGREIRIIRVMPNTLAETAYGYSALCAAPLVNREDQALAEALFGCIGETIWLAEQQFPAFTAFSCSGPAYIRLFAVALEDAGVEAGLPRDFARKAVYENLAGTAQAWRTSEAHPAQVIEQMTTPGGITIKALHRLHSSGFYGAVMDAVMTAVKKAVGYET